jgi:hypothetical protein
MKIKLKIIFHSKTSRISQQLIFKNINPNNNLGGKNTFPNTNPHPRPSTPHQLHAANQTKTKWNLERVVSLDKVSLVMTTHLNMDEAWALCKAIATFFL